jgi:hypothetical protein
MQDTNIIAGSKDRHVAFAAWTPYRPDVELHEQRLALARWYAAAGYRDMVARLWWTPRGASLPDRFEAAS